MGRGTAPALLYIEPEHWHSTRSDQSAIAFVLLRHGQHARSRDLEPALIAFDSTPSTTLREKRHHRAT